MNTNFTRAIHNEMASARAIETDYNQPGDYFVTESQYLFGGSRASGYVQSLIAKKYPTPTFNPAKVKKPSRWIKARTPPSRIRAPAVEEPETPKPKPKAPTPKAKVTDVDAVDKALIRYYLAAKKSSKTPSRVSRAEKVLEEFKTKYPGIDFSKPTFTGGPFRDVLIKAGLMDPVTFVLYSEKAKPKPKPKPKEEEEFDLASLLEP